MDSQQPRRPQRPRRNDDPQTGQFLRDSSGNIVRDRYGRPVGRRHATPPPNRDRAHQDRAHQDRAFSERPARGDAGRPARGSSQRPSQRATDSGYRRGERRPSSGQRPGSERRAGSTQRPMPRQTIDQTRIEPLPPQAHAQAPQYQQQYQQQQHQQQPHPNQKRGRKRPRFRIGKALKAFVLVLILVFGGGFIWAEINMDRVSVFSDLENRPGRSLTTNWLLVGSDSRDGLTEDDAAALHTGTGDFGQRTDTIMIASVPLIGKPTLLSIPRDSYVNIPGYGMNKINAAFSFGGAPLLTETVEQVTGIRIDHYAEVGFGGFAHIVDAIGGIEMCPPEPIDDPLAGINIQAGCQKFDGTTALGYVRTRATAMGDLDRVARQREFMSALMKRVASPWVLLNPYRLIRLVDSGTKSLAVGEGDHSWNLAWLIIRMVFGVNSETVPTTSSMDTWDAGSVLLWDEAAAEQMFAQLR